MMTINLSRHIIASDYPSAMMARFVDAGHCDKELQQRQSD